MTDKKKPERDDDPVHKDKDDLVDRAADKAEAEAAKEAEAKEAEDAKEAKEAEAKDAKDAKDAPPAAEQQPAPAGEAGPGATTATLVDAIFVNLSTTGGSNTVAALAQAFRTSEEAIEGAAKDSNTLEVQAGMVRIKQTA